MRFSVTIPAYKATYLAEAIESVLRQDYCDFELVIVNDASPEDIDSIIARYKDLRIKYFKNEKNCGAVRVVDNWNICLSHAKGDYVICMGDDDRLLPNCLSVYNELIDKYPSLDVYHGWTQIIDEQGNPYMMQEPRPERESIYSMIWNRWMGRTQYIGDFLFRAEALRKHGGFYFLPMAWGSDDISSYIAAGNKGIANSQTPVFEYRENRQTLSKTGNADIKCEAVRLERAWYLNFLNIVPNGAIDIVYYDSIKKELPRHFRIKTQRLIIRDLGDKGLHRWLFWLSKRKSVHLSSSVLFWILVIAVKNRAKRNDELE